MSCCNQNSTPIGDQYYGCGAKQHLNWSWTPLINWGYMQMGWKCPGCERCYSPSTTMCMYCGPNKYTYETTSSTGTSAEKK